MLTALRRRLTLLMTALTSLVLAGALVVTWNYAAAQYRTAAETLLTQNFSAIVDRLDSADSVSDAWLADQEHNSGCLLFLWDNGAALHFAGTTGSADARNAVEPLLEEGLSPLLDTSLHDSSGAVQRQSAGSDGIGHAAAEGVHRRSRARTAQPAGRSKSKPGRCVPHSCD